MFNNIASYFFGTNTPATNTNSETNQNPTELSQQEHVANNNLRTDAENTILVTALTPSVTESNKNNNIVQQHQQQGKRGNNKRNRSNKKQTQQQQQQQKQQPNQHNLPPPTLTKLPTPKESIADDLDENEWIIVEHEDQDVSLPQTDTEEELFIVEAESKLTSAESSSVHAVAAVAADVVAADVVAADVVAADAVAVADIALPRQQHRQLQQQPSTPHIFSRYSGPRPQQERNLRSRNIAARRNNIGGTNQHPKLYSSIRSLSPAFDYEDFLRLPFSEYGAKDYDIPASIKYGNGANTSMEESWLMTSPACVTSIELTVQEPLLFEIYESIIVAPERFSNLDLVPVEHQEVAFAPVAIAENRTNNERSPRRADTDGLTATQLLAHNNQKLHDKKQRETWCRGAMKRANMVHSYQSKGQRRSDRQHCRVVSGANNNRKSCF